MKAKIAKIAVLVLGLALLIAGIAGGELGVIERTGGVVCLECIGIG